MIMKIKLKGINYNNIYKKKLITCKNIQFCHKKYCRIHFIIK